MIFHIRDPASFVNSIFFIIQQFLGLDFGVFLFVCLFFAEILATGDKSSLWAVLEALLSFPQA